MAMLVDLATPAGMSLAMFPEIVLTLAALVLMLWAAWRHGGDSDQKTAG